MSILTQHMRPEARELRAFAGGIASLADVQLYALQNPFALDGRVSSYPASARGFSVANSYLLTEADAALLIDTGFGKDEAVIRAQIESLTAPGLPLSIFPLRLNEFMSINNVESFAGHFNVETCYTSNIDAALWRQDGRPRHPEIDEGHAGNPGGQHPGRQRWPSDRRDAGADPPDRHALALRPRDPDLVLI